MIDSLRLYRRMVAASIRAQFSYPGTLALMSVGQFLVTVIEFLGVWALFRRFGHIGGWRLGEVALFYGYVSITFSIADSVTRGFDVFGSVFVKTGAFDRLLLRPRTAALQLLGYELRLTRVGRFVQGAAVFGWGAASTHLALTPAGVAILLFGTAGGVALFSGLLVLQATLSFWTVESLEAVNILTYGGEAAAEYPLDVYAGWFRSFLLYGVPIGCVTYLPMLAAMGRADPLGTPAWLAPLAPTAGFVFLGVALFTWGFGIRRYASAGA
ncbi:MAG TPA: ABC-2 family transporter protein [Caulobacteraceae bacterium]|jgi:ABC-2 type transport system permease protein|nr:ABC-2 family transporter protein [Caulobacteraceae bacterium]